MDVQTWMMAWGPAIPILVVLLKLHYDAIHKILPRGFRNITNAMHEHEKNAERRAQENNDGLRTLQKEVHKLRKERRKVRKAVIKRRRRRRKDSPDRTHAKVKS